MTIEKPSSAEEEYFAKLEYGKKKKAAEERERLMKDEERRHLRDLHHMRCPKCGMELVEVEYRKVKIDRCASCNGMWLDAGEIEQVAEVEAGFLGGFLGLFKG